jgi:hypothetical protein
MTMRDSFVRGIRGHPNAEFLWLDLFRAPNFHLASPPFTIWLEDDKYGAASAVKFTLW